jgi:hypothetical protein
MNSWKGEFLMTNTKKKHGNKMKLMSAIGMLTVSAAMLVSSTFAWFSLNKTVTATSMQVTAKTDSTYLMINLTEQTADGIQAAGLKTVAATVDDADAMLFPASPALTAAEAGYLTTSGKKVGGDPITTAGVVVDNTAKAAAITNWFTADALAPGAATIDTGTAKQLTSFTGYVIEKTFYLTVADGSNPANNLTVTPTITQKTGGTDITAVKVLITTNDGGFYNLSSTDNNTAIDISGTNTDITDTTVRIVKAYIYYDGDETPVYTNNMANLKGADISLQFDVESNPS